MVCVDRIEIDRRLYDFVVREAIPGSGVAAEGFWRGVAALASRLAPQNAALMRRRDQLQSQIDAWHREHPGAAFDLASYRAFLLQIGYLVPEQGPFHVTTANVDPEISQLSGPQLVVPINNARYALNAANARWGSLYDALYGTDALPEDDGATRAGGFNKVRAARVVAKAREILDAAVPLASGSHADASGYACGDGSLRVALKQGAHTGLKDPAAFVGYSGDPEKPDAIVLRHHGLHFELVIDRAHRIGEDDPAGVADIMVEAAITTIQDCEASITAVDAEDKVRAHRNWLGLMNGDLKDTFEKGGRTMTRALHPDRCYTKPGGGTLWLSGRR